MAQISCTENMIADRCLYLNPIARTIDRLYRALLETLFLKPYMNFLASEFGILHTFYESRHEKTGFAAKTMSQFRCINTNSTIILLTTTGSPSLTPSSVVVQTCCVGT